MADKRLGNQFWKLRSSHGRKALFDDPQKLWECACEYFQWCDEHPWIKKEAIKGGINVGNLVEVPIQRPYTIHAFCLYANASLAWFYDFERRCVKEQKKDFIEIIHAIRETIYNQKFEGASVGTFNANLIARDLGLQEKSSYEHSGPAGGPIETDTVFRIEFVQPEKKETPEKEKDDAENT